MSLPREWSLQESNDSNRTFTDMSSVLFQEIQPSLFGTIDAQHHASDFNIIQKSSTSIQQQQQPSSKPTSEFNIIQCDQNSIIADIALFTEYNTGGSLFSIHSAPPVPLTDLNTLTNRQNDKNDLSIGMNGYDSPRRPVSLALESQQNFSTKTIAAFPLPSSEPDEDDNENLLTVSSVTARPLIAKSREIRGNKYAERFKYKPKAGTFNNVSQIQLDGGYGWLVVFGAFFVQFWVAGLVKSYGVLFVEILEIFPDSSTAVASWIPAILSALCLALAPLSSALCQRFSCRSVVFFGGLFCALGLTLSSFATSIYHLLFTFGILTGIGGGLSTTPGIIIVSMYFNKRRALANGICVSGTAAGSFVFPILIELLIKYFGFHGTILILGGCMLHVCMSAALYRPIEINTINDERFNKNDMNTTSTCISNNDKNHIEHLFMEESKNRLNDFYNTNKLVNVSDRIIRNDNADEEDNDKIGESQFMRRTKSTRSSTLLHSVEDLSTDSTCVYKSRSGYDSRRNSNRCHQNGNSNQLDCITTGLNTTDDLLEKVALNNQYKRNTNQTTTTNRGLSKSMILPTSDYSDHDGPIKIKQRKTICDRIKRYIDVTLLQDPLFIAMCLSVTLMSVGCPYMLYFLPAYAISAGFTKSEAGFLVALSAGLDLIGRLGFGYLSDLQIFDRKKAYEICICGAGVAVLTLPLAKTWYGVGCSAAAYGLCLGCWYLLMPVLLADFFGTERISSSYGLVRMFQSVGAISVPPLAGYLKDLTGGYEICFYCMGACMILGCVPLIFVALLERIDSETTEESESSTISN